ncbi:hypothetical protein [Paenibacillus sp. PL2-23]|uniref:hypothetical protein n=1 Tax=Paenibacillus sp. PL2-23 TaxID=2100729 RepID=UPI0030F50360
MDAMRYPIGEFTAIEEPTEVQRKQFIYSIAEMPIKLRQAIEGLKIEQLKTPYRHAGWSLQQIVHHLADDEMNAYQSKHPYCFWKPSIADLWLCLSN